MDEDGNTYIEFDSAVEGMGKNRRLVVDLSLGLLWFTEYLGEELIPPVSLTAASALRLSDFLLRALTITTTAEFIKTGEDLEDKD